MKQTELIQHLYDEINRQNTWYMWSVGILVTIIGLIIAYFSVLQWKLSSTQIEKMKLEAVNSITDKYDLDNLPDFKLEKHNLINSVSSVIIETSLNYSSSSNIDFRVKHSYVLMLQFLTLKSSELKDYISPVRMNILTEIFVENVLSKTDLSEILESTLLSDNLTEICQLLYIFWETEYITFSSKNFAEDYSDLLNGLNIKIDPEIRTFEKYSASKEN